MPFYTIEAARRDTGERVTLRGYEAANAQSASDMANAAGLLVEKVQQDWRKSPDEAYVPFRVISADQQTGERFVFYCNAADRNEAEIKAKAHGLRPLGVDYDGRQKVLDRIRRLKYARTAIDIWLALVILSFVLALSSPGVAIVEATAFHVPVWGGILARILTAARIDWLRSQS